MRRPVRPKQAPPTTEQAPLEPHQSVEVDEVKRLQLKQQAALYMASGVSRSRVLDQLMRDVPSLSRVVAGKLYAEVMREWQQDYERESGYHRSMQLVRLQADLVRMRTPRAGADGKPKELPWTAIARHEELVAKLTGAIAPVRVTVLGETESMREALGQMIGSMTDDEMQAIIAEGEELSDLELTSAAAE